jgi:hypothetical protein
MELLKIPQNYLERFKVLPTTNLFDIDFNIVKKGHCPLCFNKLKVSLSGDRYCRGIKHRKQFFIRAEAFNKLK